MSALPYGMFDVDYVGQQRIWDGRAVLADLVARHGPPRIGDKERRALTSIFSVIMWGELAAWKISAQLADRLEPLPAKLAASSQVHDEARHVGLGVQMLPSMIAGMSLLERIELARFHLDLYGSAVLSLKAIEPDLLSIGVDPRSLLAIGFRKQRDIEAMLREEFPKWPEDSPQDRIFAGFCELLFPQTGVGARVAPLTRLKTAVDVARRKRRGVLEIEAERRAPRPPAPDADPARAAAEVA